MEGILDLVLRELWGQWRSHLRVVPIRSTVLLLLGCKSLVKSYPWGCLQLCLCTRTRARGRPLAGICRCWFLGMKVPHKKEVGTKMVKGAKGCGCGAHCICYAHLRLTEGQWHLLTSREALRPQHCCSRRILDRYICGPSNTSCWWYHADQTHFTQIMLDANAGQTCCPLPVSMAKHWWPRNTAPMPKAQYIDKSQDQVDRCCEGGWNLLPFTPSLSTH